MTDIAIRVEQLGKAYRIGHQAGGQRGRYRTLRDDLLALPRRVWGSLAGKDARQETVWALKDVSFDVREGEVVGVIGRNGAGKSTLLKILSRITEPTTGQAEVYGRVGSLLEVGTGFHPELSGRENVYLSGAVLGMRRSEINRRFDEIVSFAEMEQFIDTPVKRYSSGMYMRLAFAVAAHLDPEILVVDEVLAVGDAEFQKKCLGKMGDLAHAGRTILFVSHNMGAINALCQRAIWVDKGAIAQEGPASAVVGAYLNSGSLTAGQMIWPVHERPGNTAFRLISTVIRNMAGNISSEINISEGYWVEIEYDVIKPGARVILVVNIFDQGGTQVFASINNGSENAHYGVPMKPGRYRSRCEIYGNLFNNGRFYITLVGMADHWSEHFRVDNVLSLEALEDGVLKRDYTGGYGGQIRPKLKWETVALGEPHTAGE